MNMKYIPMIILGVLVIAVLAVSGVAIYNEQQATSEGFVSGIGGGPEESALISDIIRDPDRYIGRTVTLEGEVDRVISPGIFILDREGTVMGDEILVVTADPLDSQAERDIAHPFRDADKVIVTGRVEQFIRAEVEDDFGLDLDDEVEVEYENKPMISATDIRQQNDR